MPFKDIDCSLKKLMIPGLSHYTPPNGIGFKKENGLGLSTFEITRNEMMPFMKQRPISGNPNEPDIDPPMGVIIEDSFVHPIDYNATFAVAPDITLKLADPSYEGQLIWVVASFVSGNPAIIILGESEDPPAETVSLQNGQALLLYAVNNKWSVKSDHVPLGLTASNPKEIYPTAPSYLNLNTYDQEGFYNFHLINYTHILNGPVGELAIKSNFLSLAVYKCGNNIIREITYPVTYDNITFTPRTIRQFGIGSPWVLQDTDVWEPVEFIKDDLNFDMGTLHFKVNKTLQIIEISTDSNAGTHINVPSSVIYQPCVIGQLVDHTIKAEYISCYSDRWFDPSNTEHMDKLPFWFSISGGQVSINGGYHQSFTPSTNYSSEFKVRFFFSSVKGHITIC